MAWPSTIFGCFAAMLAGIGLYGALDFSVKAKTREIGVRASLEASPMRVVRLLPGETLVPVAAGTVAGFTLYLASAGWIRALLYNVSPFGPDGFQIGSCVPCCGRLRCHSSSSLASGAHRPRVGFKAGMSQRQPA